MQINAIIQARMGSIRLPGKVMKNIGRKPMLQHVVERLDKSQLINKIIIAIAQEEHSPLPKIIEEFNLGSFIGKKKDVLDRYYQTAKTYKTDVVVRVTSDCPLIDPEIVDKVIAFYLKHKGKIDYVSNSLKRSYPVGLDTEVFPFESLKWAWQKADKPYQREHVTPYIYEHPEVFRLANVKNNENLSYMRWTVDEEKDLKFVREIYKRLYRENSKIFLMEDILTLLRKEPQLMEINKNVKQKALIE